MTTPRLDARARPDLWVLLSLVALSVVAWGAPLVLAPGALFWDDWVVAGSDTLRWARESGLPWIGYIHVILFWLGPWSFKVLALVATIAVGWLVFLIAGRGLSLSRGERWLLAALVVSLPLYSTRVIAILSTYNWSLAVFVLAWWLLVRRAPSDPGRARYIVAALLLFVSYTTASLLPFTALPVAHLALLSIPRGAPFWRSVVRFAGRFWYVLAAPVVFWIVRTLFLDSYGLYADYNQVSGLATLLSYDVVIIAAVIACVALAYWLFARRPQSAARRDGIAMVVLAPAVALLAQFLNTTRVSDGPTARVVPYALAAAAVVLLIMGIVTLIRGVGAGRNVTPILAVGVAAVVLAVLPYLVVGKIPSFAGWETRHQLLMPFGVAIIGLAAVRAASLLLPRLLIRGIAALAVIGFAAVSAFISLTLVADWNKQSQMIELLRDEPLAHDSTTLVFSDQAAQLNYDDRSYDFYEYTGWLATAFGDERRLGIDYSAVPDFLNGAYEPIYYAAARYRFGEWTPTDHGALVTIQPIEGATRWTLLLNQPAITVTVVPVQDLALLSIN